MSPIESKADYTSWNTRGRRFSNRKERIELREKIFYVIFASRNQKIERSPSYLSPVAGVRRRGFSATAKENFHEESEKAFHLRWRIDSDLGFDKCWYRGARR